MKPQILILGGTTEARLLAPELQQLLRDKYEIVTSLAGITKSPQIDAGKLRMGGFGGMNGLVKYIRDKQVALVIDATHPFAKAMPEHAYQASKIAGCRIIRYLRPAWEATKKDNWIFAENLDQAAATLPGSGKHALLTLGSRDLAHFKNVTGIKITARMIEQAPLESLPEDCEVILSRPPYHANDEEALFSKLKIDILVTKNSGAKATNAKLQVCRRLGIKVLMINRPEMPSVPVISSMPSMLTRLKEELLS